MYVCGEGTSIVATGLSGGDGTKFDCRGKWWLF